MNRLLFILIAGLGLSVVQPAPAQALLCSALTGCSCDVDVTPMAFGDIDPVLATIAASTSDVTVTCSGVADALPVVFARVGQGAWGTTADRQMKSAAGDRLHYNLYDSALYSTILGDGTGGFPLLAISGGLLSLGGWSTTAHIYGRVPAAATARPGAYTDTVTVRIDW